jgi:predicted nucleotidyltransferase
MKLHRDLKEFLSALNDADVRYLITGGIAVGAHGHPRYTKDIDVWVNPERENAERVVQAIDGFGFGSLGIVVEDLCDPNQMLQLGYPPNRIDLLTFATGLDFADAWARRVESEIDGVPVHLVSLSDLETNKRATGRLQDIADLRKLGFRVTPEEAAAAALKDNELE